MKSMYNKFSDDRREEFAIRTEILEDGENRVVRKHNLYPEGESYMDDMVKLYDVLTERFFGLEQVEILPCKRIKDGVEFPFIKGETYHRVLKEAITKGEKAELFRLLESYLAVVTYQAHPAKFQVTKHFQEVFGEASDRWTGEPAVEVADIDMIPSNIIINEENQKWTVIDYEWTFLCPVPVKYLRFRSILFWYNECQGHTLATWEELMKFLEVSEREEHEFRTWENHFQNEYILNCKIPFRESHKMLPGQHVNISEIIEYRKINEDVENTVVYADYGDGYDEEAGGIAYISHAKLGNNCVSGTIQIPEGAKRLKFYVSSIFGFGYVARLVDEKQRPVKYRMSGTPVNDRMHLNLQGFLTLECDVESASELTFSIYLYEMHETIEARADAAQMINERKALEKTNRDVYFALQSRISNLENELEEIKSSKWYRLVQKMKRRR